MAKKSKCLVSDQSENYYGFIVLTAGIKLDRFKKNPVMLYNHDMDKLIGRWEDLTVNNNIIEAAPHFNSKNAFGAEKEQEWDEGFLNGTSLGLKAIKWGNGSEYGFPDGTLVLLESELKEITVTPIGANANTVQLYAKDGKPLTEEQINEIKLSVAPTTSHQNKHKMDFKTLLITTLGLKADASDAEISAALTNLKNENVNLSARIKQSDDDAKAQKEAAIKAEVQLAIDSKRIKEEQRATFEKLLTADFENGKAALLAITPAVNLSTLVAEGKANGGADPADKSKWDLMTYMEKDFVGLQAMKKTNQAAYIKLHTDAGIAPEDISL